ncbi:MAG TPA: SLC13 family permease, partial [Candidatus Thermoplasmatota archaeon]|nr:SLC13 family permease [Candidatus Thermoplasmatota archaeon]
TNPRLLAVALGSAALALAGFVAGPAVGVPLWASALGGGLVAMLLAPAAGTSPLRVARGVDAGVLVFFVGLFVLVEGVRGSVAGASAYVGSSGGLVLATAVLSNLVSNVPAVLLLLPLVGAGTAVLLAVSSTFAGNATFLGSAATVIVAETARSRGAEFDVARFTLIGLPLAAATLALAWLLLG